MHPSPTSWDADGNDKREEHLSVAQTVEERGTQEERAAGPEDLPSQNTENGLLAADTQWTPESAASAVPFVPSEDVTTEDARGRGLSLMRLLRLERLRNPWQKRQKREDKRRLQGLGKIIFATLVFLLPSCVRKSCVSWTGWFRQRNLRLFGGSAGRPLLRQCTSPSKSQCRTKTARTKTTNKTTTIRFSSPKSSTAEPA